MLIMIPIPSLLPCPFCGNTDLQVIENDYCGDYFCPTVTIDCKQCPSGMYMDGTVMATVRQEIITKWNTRA